MLPRLWPLAALDRRSSPSSRCAASFAPAVLQRRATQGLIDLIAVVGLYVFAGNSGVLSFGNVAFMAVGAYVSALLTMKPGAKSVFLARFAGRRSRTPNGRACRARSPAALRPRIVALVVGWPLMRLTGVSASIATFAILVVANVVFGNWTAVTGGTELVDGSAGLRRSVDRVWLGGRDDRHRLRLSGNALGAALARLARGRSGGAGVRRQRSASPPHCLRHFRVFCQVLPAFYSRISSASYGSKIFTSISPS